MPRKTDLQQLMDGLEIIKKYDDMNLGIGAQSEMTYFYPLCKMTAEDREKLNALPSWSMELDENEVLTFWYG